MSNSNLTSLVKAGNMKGNHSFFRTLEKNFRTFCDLVQNREFRATFENFETFESAAKLRGSTGGTIRTIMVVENAQIKKLKFSEVRSGLFVLCILHLSVTNFWRVCRECHQQLNSFGVIKGYHEWFGSISSFKISVCWKVVLVWFLVQLCLPLNFWSLFWIGHSLFWANTISEPLSFYPTCRGVLPSSFRSHLLSWECKLQSNSMLCLEPVEVIKLSEMLACVISKWKTKDIVGMTLIFFRQHNCSRTLQTHLLDITSPLPLEVADSRRGS